MDLNRGAAAPHEPNKGARRPGSRVLRVLPLFGASKWRPSKNCETGGAPVLDGRFSMDRRNNQPNDGVDGEMDVGEAIKTGGTRGGGLLLIALGGEWSDEKIKKGDGASDFDGFLRT